jgi:Cu(I)/Ag(I) efflux system membrane fusion protein
MEENANTTSLPRRGYGAGLVVLIAAASAIVAGGGGWAVARRGGSTHDHGGARAAVKQQWQCPMHPGIVQDHPGDCPICGMKLVKVAGGSDAGSTPGPSSAQAKDGGNAAHKEQWQCPMHPSIVEDHPGDCPICGMKLVGMEAARGGGNGARPVLFYRSPMDPKQTSPTPRKDEMGMDYVPVHADEVGGAPPVEGLSEVSIDPARQQLIGLKINHVERGTVGGAWRTTGRIAMDETRIHHVSVKFSGFMERVHADFVGKPVKKGEPLFSIYSPELLAAQQEYLLALDTRRQLAGASGMAGDGDALVAAARRKLELWDVPRSEIERFERSGEGSRTITFFSPATGVVTKKEVVPGMRVAAGDMPFEVVDLSRVWFLADAYESDLSQVKVGMPAKLTLKAFPNRAFKGRVAFIDPVLDPKTRTAKVRIEFANPTGELRPEMFGEAVLRENGHQGLRIPADAVIHSGTKSVVFVALQGGKFQPREVELGQGDSEFVEVLSGLQQGDGVVTRANFLIDSESRLRASLAALSTSAAVAARTAHADTEPGAPVKTGSSKAGDAVRPVLTPAMHGDRP